MFDSVTKLIPIITEHWRELLPLLSSVILLILTLIPPVRKYLLASYTALSLGKFSIKGKIFPIVIIILFAVIIFLSITNLYMKYKATENYMEKSEVEKDYMKKSEVEKYYIEKSEVEKDYMKKSEVEKDYMGKNEVAKYYMGKNEVAKNYMEKSEVAKYYMEKSEVAKDYMGKSEVAKYYMEKSEVAKNYMKKCEVANYVGSTDTDDKQAQQTGNHQKNGESSWELLSSKSLVVTVPGHIEQGNAHVCAEHHNEKYILYANYDKYSLRKKAVTVKASKHIMSASDCPQKTKGYDMQISCTDAKIIFPQEIDYCDKVMRIPYEKIQLDYPNALEEIKKCHKTTNKELIYECNDNTRRYFTDIECNADPKWNLHNVPWNSDLDPPDPNTGRLKVLAVPTQ